MMQGTKVQIQHLQLTDVSYDDHEVPVRCG